jgi:ATP-dependent RNA helicase DeaD
MVNYKDLGLVNTREMFKRAVAGGYAIPAFNFNTMEQMQAIVMAAVETKSPVIMQVSKGARAYANGTILRNVVMDEADEMLNMGFTDSINAILEQVPQDRNTLMFSATMSPEISRIAKQYLHDAHEITIGTKNEGSKNVNHIAYIVHAKDKYAALKRVADYYPQIYGIIFCRTRKETQEIADKLIQDGYNADSLHGELSQAQRDLVMGKFRQRHLQLLVATDVAARGLDVNDLTHVINYGLPEDTESYTHRSGRTGRAGKTGISIAIINLREKGRMREIERIINKKFTIGALPTGQQICEQQLIKLMDDIEKVKVNEEEIEAFLPGIYRKLEWLSKEDLLKRVVSLEFNRFLDYYKDAPEIETVSGSDREPREGKRDRGSKGDKQSRQAEAGYTRLFLNVGKQDGFYANQIIDLVNRNMRKGTRPTIGRIDLMQNFSFFEVLQEEAHDVIRALNRAQANGRRIVVEEAGENNGKSDKGGKKRGARGERDSRDSRGERGERAEKKSRPEKKERAEKKAKPSREERGYTSARGPKKKDDWKQFFAPENSKWELKGDMPDFEEEGWARRKKKK